MTLLRRRIILSASNNTNESAIRLCIQHVDGTLYTQPQWESRGFLQSDANGVAVVSKNIAFVIAKNNLGELSWSLGEGAMSGTATENPMSDFDGKGNTERMLHLDSGGAIYSCANYVFPNGQRGYLPALGELSILQNFETTINRLLKLIGGEGFGSLQYWSSSQASAEKAYFWTGSVMASLGKNYIKYVRPFTTIETVTV